MARFAAPLPQGSISRTFGRIPKTARRGGPMPAPTPVQDSNPVLVERRAGYRVITLNQPQRLNALTEAMHPALKQALAEAEDDEDCRALLLTGTGRGFCAGQDLNERVTPD